MICPYCYARHPSGDLLMSCGPSCSPRATFPAKSLQRNRCAHGRLPRAQRRCPSCDRAVPREYAESSSRAVFVTGAGKSTWITSVIRHLSTGEVVPGLSVRLLGDSSRARFADLRPKSAEPILLSLRHPNADPAVLALYELPDDCPPDLLATAAGIVRLIDPAGLPRVQQLLGQQLLGSRAAPPPPPAFEWPPHLPVALVLTKLDLVWDMFDHGSPLRRLTPPTSAYSETDGLDVHHEVAAWLARWGDLPAGHRCFALSPHAAGYRVADPLLWLLTRFGAFGVGS